MRAGTLRQNVQLQRRTEARVQGEMTTVYVPHGQAAADIRPDGGVEIRDGVIVERSGYEIRLRWTPHTATLKPRDRIVFDSVEYDIENIENVANRNRELRITAEVRDPNAESFE